MDITLRKFYNCAIKWIKTKGLKKDYKIKLKWNKLWSKKENNIDNNLIKFFNKILHLLYYSYETSDGVSRQETAELKNVGTETEALVVRGSYSFVADDGQTYTVTYIADENGFQPSAPHIPKA